MKGRFLNQVKALFLQNLKIELSTPERFLSPLLFSITIIIMFSFAMGKMEPSLIVKTFIAQTYLTAFFALQVSFARAFDPDTHDGVFQQMRTYPVISSAWFLSKYAMVVFMGSLILIPTMLVSLFFSPAVDLSIPFDFLLIPLLVILGLSPIGVLLSTMTMRSGAKQIIFPILYFPMTAPVLIAAVESSQAILLQQSTVSELMNSWLGLLSIFDIIYITLGLMLFGELVKAE